MYVHVCLKYMMWAEKQQHMTVSVRTEQTCFGSTKRFRKFSTGLRSNVFGMSNRFWYFHNLSLIEFTIFFLVLHSFMSGSPIRDGLISGSNTGRTWSPLVSHDVFSLLYVWFKILPDCFCVLLVVP